jgi:hypothetical protein
MTTHPTTRSRRSAMPFALLALAGAALAPYGVLASQISQSDVSGTATAVGELVHGHLGLLAAAATILFGLAWVAAGLAARRALPVSPAVTAGSGLLVIGGLLAIVWGAAPMDAGGDAETFVGGVHAVAGTVSALAIAIGAICLSHALRHRAGYGGIGRVATLLALTAAALMVATWFVPQDAFGAVQRLWLLAADAWLLTVAFRLCAPPSAEEEAAPARAARPAEAPAAPAAVPAAVAPEPVSV